MRPLSASLLNNFLDCRHRAALWAQRVPTPEEIDPNLALLQRRGFEHEAKVLAHLEQEFGPATRITTASGPEAAGEATKAAVLRGDRLIYQAALRSGNWIGYPDFLVLRPQPNGEIGYQPEDAKLAHAAKEGHGRQLAVYADLMAELFGERPSRGVIHGGIGPILFDLDAIGPDVRASQAQLEQFLLDLPTTQSARVKACGQCPYLSRCESEWRAADSPVFVAGIRADQISSLADAGVVTMSDLARIDPSEAVIPGISDGALARLIQQARLQKIGGVEVALLAPLPGKGFDALPPPDRGDLSFDMEGDPHYPGGLEYLFGLWGAVGDQTEQGFLPLWAHDRAAEKAQFETLIDLLTHQFQRFPNAHVYHYASYEVTALKRLSIQFETRQDALSLLLAAGRFIDLYRIVKQALAAPTESYSLKALEKLYWQNRTGAVTSAGGSIVAYEAWRETPDEGILTAIADYNRDDVLSTMALRDWLEALRPRQGSAC